jgi:hypothetical protein
MFEEKILSKKSLKLINLKQNFSIETFATIPVDHFCNQRNTVL